MKELEQYRDYMKRLPAEVKEAEIEAEKEVIVSASVLGGEIAGMTYSEVIEGFVRASDENTGLVYTQNFSADPKEMILKALDNGRYAGRGGREPMITKEEIGEEIREAEKEAVSAEELSETAKRYASELQQIAGKGLCTQVTLSQVIRTKSVVNSKGVDETASDSCILAEIGAVEERTGRTYSSYRSAKRLSGLNAEEERAKIERFLDNGREEGKFKPGTYRVLLDQEVTTNILMHAWQLFSGLNYESGSSAYSGKLGQKIMPEFLSISDQPDTKESAFCWRIDCEGSPCAKTKIVENGVFTGLMHNLTSAEAAGAKTTGNGGRKTLLSGNIHTDMRVMPTNFIIEPGDKSFEELISLLDNGIYINDSLDVHHSLEIASGRFAIPCEGIIVRNGKMESRVTGLSMNGNLRDLFANVTALGNELNFRPFDMYQSYVLMGPAMLVDGIEVAG